MARNYTSGNYASKSSPVDPGGAGSIFIRVNPNWNGGDGVAHSMWAYLKTGLVNFHFHKFTNNNIYAGWAISGEQRIIIAGSALFTAGTWGNWLYTWDDVADSQVLYKDNSSVGTSATAFTAATALTGFGIGAESTGLSPADALLAEYGRWNRVLTSDERAVLEVTGCPLTIPRGLIRYYPLINTQSPINDRCGNEHLTVTGTPAAAAHPRIFLPASPRVLRWVTPTTVVHEAQARVLARSGMTARATVVRGAAARFLADSRAAASSTVVRSAQARVVAPSRVAAYAGVVRGASVRVAGVATVSARLAAVRLMSARVNGRSAMLVGEARKAGLKLAIGDTVKVRLVIGDELAEG